ncbi:MAG TPA: c-type cytochrome biogenesis protein CcmI, partial [Methylococcaceae bacterium]|nr:c-type cytochrome biogenesis protein CcmI [Methylococcaceae bacterium]
GVITQTQFDALQNELMLHLHQDLSSERKHTLDENKGRWLALPIAVFVPLLSLAFYSIKGDLRAFDVPTVTAAGTPKTAADINAMVEKLAQKMAQNPQDPQGWIMLARSYKVLKRYPDAVNALRKARVLLGDDPQMLLQLADVLAMQNGGSLLGEPADLVAKALARDANNDMGLWLSGLAKAEAGQFKAAIKDWQTLQTHYKADEEDYVQVQKLIDQANEALNEASGASTPAAQPPVATGKTLHLAIALDDKFKAQVNDNDTVFIYAQPVQGGKMPLAVVKKQVKELPLEVTLDDSMAMMPAMTLSSVANVQLSARVSKSGNATPQSGEPIGKKQVSTLVDSGVIPLIISDTVP